MTMTGLIFKSYAEEIVNAHGFRSNKMVKENSPWFVANEMSRGQHFANLKQWGRDEQGLEKAEEVWNTLDTVKGWLIDNGYLRRYTAKVERGHYFKVWTGDRFVRAYRAEIAPDVNYIGLTAKGWSVANKYLNAKI